MQSGDGPQAGERWNVNMPAVFGVVFVFLLGVVVWVVASPPGDADEPETVSTTRVSASAAELDQTTAPTTSPTPLPTTLPATVPATDPAGTTVPPTTTTASDPTTIPPTTTRPAPATTAPGADDDAVPGDLAVPGRPMERPPCDGAYITVLASPVGEQATTDGVAEVLDQYPASNYLRTDQTCPSLTPDVDGEPIYVIYLGPFAVASDACSARVEGPEGAYARELSDELGPDHSVDCA
jgi:serine/threonine-protein kinase